MKAVGRVLILHGWKNRRPENHWQYWLAERLRERSIPVAYPQFPEPDTPILETWLELLEAELKMLGPGERTVICHSLSCMLWLHAAHRQIIVCSASRVLFVAPPGLEAFTPACRTFAPIAFDRDAVNRSCEAPIKLLSCAADPSCPGGAHARYAARYSMDSETLPGASHFTPEDGFGPWPALLGWVENSSRRLVTDT